MDDWLTYVDRFSNSLDHWDRGTEKPWQKAISSIFVIMTIIASNHNLFSIFEKKVDLYQRIATRRDYPSLFPSRESSSRAWSGLNQFTCFPCIKKGITIRCCLGRFLYRSIYRTVPATKGAEAFLLCTWSCHVGYHWNRRCLKGSSGFNAWRTLAGGGTFISID